MGVLAHVFEAAGIATITLASMRGVVEKLQPPRSLFCNFPLGRPLGHPGNAGFQHDVLTRAFALLEEPSGPVLVDHPEVIEASDQALSCQLPPVFDPTLHPAVDEANGIRKAYDRSVAKRGTSVGRVVDADGVPAALEVLASIVEGTFWKEAGIPGGNTIAVAHDIRTYYEEAALELVEGPPPGGRAAEAWYFEKTQAGTLILAVRKVLAEQEAPFPVHFYMAPGHR